MKLNLPRDGWGTLLLALSLLGYTGCQRSARVPDTDTSTSKIGGRGMNVLMVSVDTTRADSLGCYGHPIVKTPNVDRLAAEGTRFAECVSSVPITLPSHATMMTGSYPFVHGARDNGVFVLDEENVTLAEIFQQAGYATHAEVAAMVLNRRYGLDQGFDTYGDLDRRKSVATGAADIEEAAYETAGDMQPADGYEEPKAPELPTAWSLFDRKGDEVTPYALELLKEVAQGDQPFFMFLHYFDPHQPYEAPERFREHYKDPYLAEIAFFDEQFGLIMDALRDLGLAEETLVILASDHGEGRGQHGEQTHSYFIYDSTLLVPLIMWCPGQVPAGQVVETQVRLLDLAPTIVDFVRLERSRQMQGTSLLPRLVAPSFDPHVPCYADTLAGQVTFGYSPLRCVRHDGWKYILSPEPELYHLAADRLELMNLAELEPERAAAMRAQLQRIIAESPPTPGRRAATQVIDEEELRKLQALGYLAGSVDTDAEEPLVAGTELDHFEPAGVNPRDRIELIELLNLALGALLGGEYESAEGMYRRLLEVEPNNARLTKELANAVAAQGRLDEAEELFHRTLELDPIDAMPWMGLGRISHVRGDLQGAEQQYRHAIELDLTHHAPRLQLANVLSEQRRFSEAFVEYEAAAELAPDVPAIPLRWGLAYRAVGRLQDAEEKLRQACELDPDLADARLHLAHLLGGLGRRTEAIQQLLALLQAHPQNIAALQLLASEYTKQGDYESAKEYLKRAAQIEPEGPRAIFDLGRSLALAGKLDGAIVEYRKAIELKPDFVLALAELAGALEKTGQVDEALQTCERLFSIAPRYAAAYLLAAELLMRRGDATGAIDLLRRGNSLLPDDFDIASDLAWRLATCGDERLRNGREAVKLAEHATALAGKGDPYVLDTLAAAYAEAGRFADAVATARRALESAKQTETGDLVERIDARCRLYENQQPYHER